MKEADIKNSFLGSHIEKSTYRNSQIAVLPISFSGNKNRSLQNDAAGEIIKASRRLELYDEEQSREFATEKGICTLASLNVSRDSYKKATEKISKLVNQLLADEKFIVSISDDHSTSLGAIKAFSEKYKNFSILHLDSRANLKTSAESKLAHDSLMNNVADFNANIVQVGIRSLSKSENEFRKEKKIKQFLASEIKLGMYGNDWQEIVEKNLGDDVYISIDLSAFNPSIFPNVEKPEPGGLLWDEVLYLLKIVGQGRNVIGFDICGLQPNKNIPASNYFAAKLLYKILNYAV